MLAESDLSGNITAEYVYFNGKRLARTDNPTNAETSALRYYISDQLGSTDMVMNETFSQVLEDIDYYPYGGIAQQTGLGDLNHFLFTGKERDSETGNDYFGARYYASNMGRFMTPDWAARPITVPYANFGDPQSLNLYGYVRNDPVSVADADGHELDTSDNTVPEGTYSTGSGSGQAAAKAQSDYKERKEKEQKEKADKDKKEQDNKSDTGHGNSSQQAQTGHGVLLTAAGAVDAGVGKAGATAQGAAGAGVFVDSKNHPSLGAQASGSVMANAGQHSTGAPQQDSQSSVVGAFVGVGGGVTFTNAGNATAMKSMTNTLNIDIGWDYAASFSISSGSSGIWSISITIGCGYGLGVTETNTATATASTP